MFLRLIDNELLVNEFHASSIDGDAWDDGQNGILIKASYIMKVLLDLSFLFNERIFPIMHRAFFGVPTCKKLKYTRIQQPVLDIRRDMLFEFLLPEIKFFEMNIGGRHSQAPEFFLKRIRHFNGAAYIDVLFSDVSIAGLRNLFDG